MSKGDVTEFVNPYSGETLRHKEMPSGRRDLFVWGPGDAPDGPHDRATWLPSGGVSLIKDRDGRTIADDRIK